MYTVISKWEIKPGKEQQAEAASKRVRGVLRSTPGVVSLEGMRSGNTVYAVVTYESEATRDKIVKDPNGPFAKAIAENGLEEFAEWKWSEGGEKVED